METLTCSICLEEIDFIDKKTLECEHYFHKQCIVNIVNKECPLCKRAISSTILENIQHELDNRATALNDSIVVHRMSRENVNSGELHVSLIWNDIADLDLHVICPSGEEIYFSHKESRCGGWLDIDMNAGSNHSLEPIENVFWSSSPNGHYKIFVHNFNNRTKDNSVFTDHNRRVPFRVRLTKNGETEWFSSTVGSRERVTCFEFDHNHGSGALGSFISLPGQDRPMTIKEHCELNNVTYTQGAGYYCLTKKEKISKKKDLLLHNTQNDTYIIGHNDVLNSLQFNPNEDNNIKPTDIPSGYDLYVQSTSHNRNIPGNTKVLMNVGIREALRYRRGDIYTNL